MEVTVLLVLYLIVSPSVGVSNVPLGQCQITCGHENTENNQIITANRGRPGKQGPKGPTGLTGPPGPRRNACLCVNVDDVKAEVELLQNSLQQMKEKITPANCSYKRKSFARARDRVEDIYPFGYLYAPVKALCDMTTMSRGWTVIQHRFNGLEDFYRTWDEYVESIKYDQMLRVDLEYRKGNVGYATYSTFIVGSAETNYTLTIGGYEGNIGDSLKYHNSKMSSTKDVDNDKDSRNCATARHGAWWYNGCLRSNLNGDYVIDGSSNGVAWFYWKGGWNSMKKTKMMITRKP